jgi:hypothetical protein
MYRLLLYKLNMFVLKKLSTTHRMTLRNPRTPILAR